MVTCDLGGNEYASDDNYPDESYCPDCIREVFSSNDSDIQDLIFLDDLEDLEL